MKYILLNITAIDDFMQILSFKISGKAHFYQLIRNKNVHTNLQLESTYHIVFMLDKPSIKKILGTTNMEFKKNFIKIQILLILGLVGNTRSCSVYCDFSNNDGEVCASNGQTYKNR